MKTVLATAIFLAIALTAHAAGVSYVNKNDTSCDGNNPCYPSIQAAIEAEPGGVIQVAQGCYDGNPEATGKSFSIQGGWDSSFSNQTANSTFIKTPKVFDGSMRFQEINFFPYYFGAADIIIDYGPHGDQGDKKKGVSFSHGKHIMMYKQYVYNPPVYSGRIECVDCHHRYVKGSYGNMWKPGDPVKKCIECHVPGKTTKIDGIQVMKLQNAFHKNCKNCHKACAKFMPSGPFSVCADCHNAE